MDQSAIKILRDVFLRDLEEEFKITQRVLKAAAQGDANYKPDQHAKSAFELAWHLASTECWFADAICKGAFEGLDEMPMADHIKTASDIPVWHEKNFNAALNGLKALTLEQLSRSMDFFGIANLPAVIYMAWLRNHSIHHRGQLSAYLRPMGSKVPQIYGGSYDQPIQM